MSLSPFSREPDTLSVSRLGLRSVATAVANVALDLGCSAQLILCIVYNLATGDNDVRAEQKACADLPDGVAS